MTESNDSQESDSHSEDNTKAALSENKQAAEDEIEQLSEARDRRRRNNSQTKRARVEKSESPNESDESWSPEDGAGYIPGVSAEPSDGEGSGSDDSDKE